MHTEFHACPESGVSPGRGRFSCAVQAINCLATIVKSPPATLRVAMRPSLRDKKPTQLLRSSAKLTRTGGCRPATGAVVPPGQERSQTPSPLYGMPSWAPDRVVFNDAALIARWTALSRLRPSAIPTPSHPTKQSPAPVVSTGTTLVAGIEPRFPSAKLANFAPAAPNVTTTARQPCFANQSTAASISSSPLRLRASCSFTTKTFIRLYREFDSGLVGAGLRMNCLPNSLQISATAWTASSLISSCEITTSAASNAERAAEIMAGSTDSFADLATAIRLSRVTPSTRIKATPLGAFVTRLK